MHIELEAVTARENPPQATWAVRATKQSKRACLQADARGTRAAQACLGDCESVVTVMAKVAWQTHEWRRSFLPVVP